MPAETPPPTVPFAGAPPQPGMGAIGRGPVRFTVMVTDDDPGSREALGTVLASHGLNVVEAKSGEEAIDLVRVELVHLIFFDMHMPRMTGLEALQQVRLFNELLPAILMSADVTRELVRAAHQAQVYSVIPKPVNKGVVLHTLTRALQRIYGVPATPAATEPDKPS